MVLYAFPDSTAQALAGTLWVVDSTDTRAATLTIAGQVVAPPPAPDNPTKASRTVLSGNRSEVSWAKVAGATGYEVQSSGRVVCTAGARASSCVTKKAFGPRVGVWVTARNDFGVSDGVEAKYRAPDSPVTFAAVSFTGRSTTLRKSTRAHAADAGTALAKQGFSKDITVVAGTRSGRSVARVRAQTVQRLILDRYADYPDIDPPSLATAVRGAGNGVRITVE